MAGLGPAVQVCSSTPGHDPPIETAHSRSALRPTAVKTQALKAKLSRFAVGCQTGLARRQQRFSPCVPELSRHRPRRLRGVMRRPGRPDTDLVLTLPSISSPRAAGGKETAMIGSRNLCCGACAPWRETQHVAEESNAVPFTADADVGV